MADGQASPTPQHRAGQADEVPCPHGRQFVAGGSHEFQAVHPQTVLSPLESLKEKMRLKS